MVNVIAVIVVLIVLLLIVMAFRETINKIQNEMITLGVLALAFIVCIYVLAVLFGVAPSPFG